MPFIITCKLPSGTKAAFSRLEDKEKVSFALVLFDENGVKGASVWNSKEDAEGYLKAQLECAPTLSKLEPFEIEEAHMPPGLQ